MAGMSERLAAGLCRIEGVVEGESSFKDGPAFWAGGKEIAHFEGAHAIDLRLTRAQIRARRDELRADARVVLRSASSDWLTVEFRTPGRRGLRAHACGDRRCRAPDRRRTGSAAHGCGTCPAAPVPLAPVAPGGAQAGLVGLADQVRAEPAPIAAAIGSSPRVLIYLFGTGDEERTTAAVRAQLASFEIA